MITKKQKDEILEIVGINHNSKILQFFAEKGINNRDGLPYSTIFVSRVFNGHVSNPTIEAGIFEFMQEYPARLRKLQEKENDRRQGILDDAKTAVNV